MMPTYETYIIDTIENTDLHLYLYRSSLSETKGNVLYLHGGGLVYGSARDMPASYIEQITAAGYNFLALEYPLAPEVKLDTIFTSVKSGIHWFAANATIKLGLDHSDYILFGRSAGAYLAVNAALRTDQKPQALWLFYGYHTLREATFQVPSRHYLQFPRVDERLVKQLIKSHPLADGPKETRYALYIHYRQTGKWIADLVPAGNKPITYSLTKADLETLPPTFLAASTNDPDVPYRLSKTMAAAIPDALLETIESDEHDFDRTTTETIGKAVYAKALSWLAERL
ncbi:alpha/beta hydrolase [Jeotgalibaca sp. A127]|uniref:alpha/beta hydrolase n=1 Tax=Jeotgalibaca sp. A127 TaxID=3457324 RepID=UPI003FD46913